MWLILFYPFIEIYLFYKFVQAYSFVDGLLFLLSSALLGLLILGLQGKSVANSLRENMAQGQIPSNRIIHRACIMFGGLLLIIPGLLSDLLGVLLILPGTRHLFILYFKAKILRGLQNGRVRFFSNVDLRGQAQYHRPPERDAQVVDVTPIEVTHQKISSSEKPSDS